LGLQNPPLTRHGVAVLRSGLPKGKPQNTAFLALSCSVFIEKYQWDIHSSHICSLHQQNHMHKNKHGYEEFRLHINYIYRIDVLFNIVKKNSLHDSIDSESKRVNFSSRQLN
jgi:hypothetical protein